ncbi:MAG: hypothetical protein U5K75_12185 [Ahrensia sp.]|nr:hypothetical protein [Ahrensia sp.]
MTKILAALDVITHAVLFYRPADKGQAAATIERRVKALRAKKRKAIKIIGNHLYNSHFW